jgi:hypothetical protein
MRKLDLQTQRKGACNQPKALCKANSRYIQSVQRKLSELKALQAALDDERANAWKEFSNSSSLDEKNTPSRLDAQASEGVWQEVKEMAGGTFALFRLAGRLAFCKNSTERRLLEMAYDIQRNKTKHFINVTASAVQVMLATSWKSVVIEVVRLVTMYCPFIVDNVIALTTEMWDALANFARSRASAQVSSTGSSRLVPQAHDVDLTTDENIGFLGSAMALVFTGKVADITKQASRLTLSVGRHAKCFLECEKAIKNSTDFFSKFVSWFKAALLLLVPSNFMTAKFLDYLKDQKIDLASFVRRTNDLTNPEPRHRAAVLYDEQTATKLSVLNEEASRIQFAITEKKINPGPNAAHTVADTVKRLRDFTVEYYSSSTCQYSRMAPFVVCFFGAPGTGKSLFLKDFAHAIVSKENGTEVDWNYENLIIANSSASKYFDNYRGQEIEIQDDFGQGRGAAPNESEFVQQTCKVSSTPWMPPMAAVADKGIPYTSRVILQTTNTPFPAVNEMFDVTALDRRRNLLVEVVIHDASLDQFDPNRCRYNLCAPKGAPNGNSFRREVHRLEMGLTFDELVFRTVQDVNKWVHNYNANKSNPVRNIFAANSIADSIDEASTKLRSQSISLTARAFYETKLRILAREHPEARTALQELGLMYETLSEAQALQAQADDGPQVWEWDDENESFRTVPPQMQSKLARRKPAPFVTDTSLFSRLDTWRHLLTFVKDRQKESKSFNGLHFFEEFWRKRYEIPFNRVCRAQVRGEDVRTYCLRCYDEMLDYLEQGNVWVGSACDCCNGFACQCDITEMSYSYDIFDTDIRVCSSHQRFLPTFDFTECVHAFDSSFAEYLIHRFDKGTGYITSYTHDSMWPGHNQYWEYQKARASGDAWFEWYGPYQDWTESLFESRFNSIIKMSYPEYWKMCSWGWDIPYILEERRQLSVLDDIIGDVRNLWSATPNGSTLVAQAFGSPFEDSDSELSAADAEELAASNDESMFSLLFQDAKAFLAQPLSEKTLKDKVITIGLTVVAGLFLAVSIHQLVKFVSPKTSDKLTDLLCGVFRVGQKGACATVGCEGRSESNTNLCAKCIPIFEQTCAELVGQASFYGESDIASAFKRRRIFNTMQDTVLRASQKEEIAGKEVIFEAQGSEDPNSLSLKHSLGMKNCVKLSVGKKNALGLGITDRLILANRHFIDIIPESGRMAVEGMGHTFYFSYDKEDVYDLYESTGTDLVVIRATKDVPQFRDIVDNFVTNSDLEKLGHFSASLVGTAPNGLGYSLQLLPQVEMMLHPINYKNSVGEYSIAKSFKYSCESQRGYSGATLVLNSTLLPRKICGMHIAGDPHRNYGHSAILTREMIEPALQHFRPVKGTVNSITAQASEGCRLAVAVGGNTDILGPALPEMRQRTPFRTDIYPGPLMGHLGEPKKGPSVMSFNDARVTNKPAEFRSPLEAGFAKYEEQTVPFLKGFLTVACMLAYTKIKNAVTGALGRRILTEEEMLNGKPGVYDRVDISTSPGLPWKLYRPQSMKGKRHLFDVLENDDYTWGTTSYNVRYAGKTQTIVPGEELRKATYDLESRLKDPAMDVEGLVSYENLKQELLKMSKIETGTTRLFSCAPLHYNLLVRKYFGSWVAAMNAQPWGLPSSVGINPLGFDWTQLAQRLLTKGDYMIAGDYKQWDGKLLGSVMDAAVDVINDWYAGTEEENLVRKRLIDYAIHTPTICQDGVYMKHQGLPSGIPITADINSLCNFLYMACVFQELKEKHGKCENCQDVKISQFNQLVECAFYGDDHILSVAAPARCYFTFNAIQKCFEEHGVTYTDALKTGGASPDFEPLSRVSYLKRGFRPFMGRYSAPLDMTSIVENLNWVRKGNVPEEVLPGQLDSAFTELFQHGKSVFVEQGKRIVAAVESSKAAVELRPYLFEEYLEDWIESAF